MPEINLRKSDGAESKRQKQKDDKTDIEFVVTEEEWVKTYG